MEVGGCRAIPSQITGYHLHSLERRGLQTTLVYMSNGVNVKLFDNRKLVGKNEAYSSIL